MSVFLFPPITTTTTTNQKQQMTTSITTTTSSSFGYKVVTHLNENINQQNYLEPTYLQQQQQQQQWKRNSFHGFCLPGTPLDYNNSYNQLNNFKKFSKNNSGIVRCLQCTMILNDENNYLNNNNLINKNKQQIRSIGSTGHLLEPPKINNNKNKLNYLKNNRISSSNSASCSPTPSEEDFLLMSTSPTSSSSNYYFTNPQPKPKYSLNLRPEDCSNNNNNLMNINNNNNLTTITPPPPPLNTGRNRTITNIIQRQQGSTDSAPTTSTGGINRMKRKEIWARVGPSSFHQSFDIRSDPISNISTSCSHIDDSSGGVCCICKGYRTERRSGFCSGDSSRDYQNNTTGTLTLFCGVPGCSGHPSCPATTIQQNQHLHITNRHGRSSYSSFDEGDQGSAQISSGGHLRDTYLTEISREWMLMNGAIAPFKHILQQASSIASTPLSNHRPFQSIATPAAAASAVNTASAIMTASSRIAGSTNIINNNIKSIDYNNEEEIFKNEKTIIKKNSCSSTLIMTEQNENKNIQDQLTTKFNNNFDQQKQIIIIEPNKKLEGNYNIKIIII